MILFLQILQQIRACFDMYAQVISAGILNGLIVPGFNDHQWTSQYFFVVCGQTYDHRAETDVGYKTSIHNIQMKPIGLTFIQHVTFIFQFQEISSEKRRSDNGHECKIEIWSTKSGIFELQDNRVLFDFFFNLRISFSIRDSVHCVFRFVNVLPGYKPFQVQLCSSLSSVFI